MRMEHLHDDSSGDILHSQRMAHTNHRNDLQFVKRHSILILAHRTRLRTYPMIFIHCRASLSVLHHVQRQNAACLLRYC